MKYIAGLIMVVLSGCVSRGQQEMKFDLSGQAGKRYNVHIYRETSKKFLKYLVGDTMDLEVSMHVLPKQGGLNRISISFLDLRVRRPKVRANGSEIDVSAIVDSVFWPAKGLSVQASVDEKGITRSVDGMSELFRTISARLNKKLFEVKPWLNDYMGEDAVKDNLNRLFSVVAAKKVEAGENWASDVVLTAKAPVNINSMYTLTGLSADSAFVDIHSIIVAGTAGNFYLNGEQNGMVVLNYRSGVPYRYETEAQTVTKTVSYDVVERERYVVWVR